MGGVPVSSIHMQIKLKRSMHKAMSILDYVGSARMIRKLDHIGVIHDLTQICLTSRIGHHGRNTPEIACGLLVSGWCMSGVLGFVCAGFTGAVSFASLSVVAATLWTTKQVRKRRDHLAHQVPEVFRSLARALGSGKTLSQAISFVGARNDETLSREFGRAALKVSCGISTIDALKELAQRTQAPGIDLMICALNVSARTGAALQGLFMRSASVVVRRFELEQQLVSKTAQVRLSSRIVSALPVGLVGILAIISPDFQAGLTTPIGATSIAVSIALDVTTLLIIKHLIKGIL